MNELELKLDECQEKLGYRFKTIRYLFTALMHSSFAPTHQESNERLEFLGDAVLGLAVANMLFKHFPNEAEGPLSVMRSAIVSRKSCCRVARQIGIDHFLFIARGIHYVPDSMIANLMEAVIGAVYLDAGYDAVRPLIEKWFQSEIELFLKTDLMENHKAVLQSLAKDKFSCQMVEYLLVDEKGPQHLRCFEIQVKIGACLFPAAWGNNKKEAEQHAAENAIAVIENKPVKWSNGE